VVLESPPEEPRLAGLVRTPETQERDTGHRIVRDTEGNIREWECRRSEWESSLLEWENSLLEWESSLWGRRRGRIGDQEEGST